MQTDLLEEYRNQTEKSLQELYAERCLGRVCQLTVQKKLTSLSLGYLASGWREEDSKEPHTSKVFTSTSVLFIALGLEKVRVLKTPETSSDLGNYATFAVEPFFSLRQKGVTSVPNFCQNIEVNMVVMQSRTIKEGISEGIESLLY